MGKLYKATLTAYRSDKGRRHRNTAVMRYAAVLAVAVYAASMSSSRTDANAGIAARACPTDAIPVEAGSSIQRAVEDALPYTSFCLKSGVYRLQSIKPKNGQSFFGEGKTVLDGSRILDAFERDGNLYFARVPRFDPWRPHGVCTKRSPACDVPQSLFIDDRALVPVPHKNDITPGHFYFDRTERRVYFDDDPAGHKVEIAIAPFAFGGPAINVTIQNLTVQKYASVPQEGAIQAQQGWVVEHCEVRQNSAAGIGTKTDTRVSQCNIHHNGQIGITGDGNSIVIENNEVWANNTRGFDYGWEAGGVKIALGRNIVMRGNRVHDNAGPGLWCDGSCRNTLYERNVVEGNQGAGIYHEVSYSAIIRDNVLIHNGLAGGWFWGSQVIVAASQGVDVEHNRLEVGPGKCGIMLIDQGRNDGPHGTIVPTYKTRNNSVKFNETTFEGDSCAGGVSDVAPGKENYSMIEDGNNIFDWNTYRIRRSPAKHIFAWGHAETDWDSARRLGFEPHGRIVTD